MFEDKDYIKNLVNQRDDDQIVIPLYVQIYGKKYSLLELKDVKVRFTEGAFKVGYCTADALFMPNSFPINRIRDFDVITVFTEYDDKKDRTIRYMVFESGNIDPPADEYVNFDMEENDKLSEQIRTYFEMLYNHTKNVVDEYFKSLIAQEEHPIIPKEEKVPMQVGIKEYSGELSKYSSSWDPKFVNEETPEEDPLEALRKEVAEYSQADDEDDKLLIVETDNTGTEIESATEATLDLPKDVEFGDGLVDMFGNEVNDDYLSETSPALIVETDKTGTEIVSATKVDVITDDYSTDFDIL